MTKPIFDKRQDFLARRIEGSVRTAQHKAFDIARLDRSGTPLRGDVESGRATASTDSRSWRRGTMASIDAHTWLSVISPPESVTSSSTSTAAASRDECRARSGCRRARSLPVADSTLPTSSVVTSRSNSSRQSLTDRASR